MCVKDQDALGVFGLFTSVSCNLYTPLPYCHYFHFKGRAAAPTQKNGKTGTSDSEVCVLSHVPHPQVHRSQTMTAIGNTWLLAYNPRSRIIRKWLRRADFILLKGSTQHSEVA